MQFQRDESVHGYAKEQDATALLKAEEEWGIKCVDRICNIDDGNPPDIVVCEGQASVGTESCVTHTSLTRILAGEYPGPAAPPGEDKQ